MFEKLQGIDHQYEELVRSLASSEVASDPKRYAQLTKSFSDLEPVVTKYREHCALTQQIAEARAMLERESDDEMRAFVYDELRQLEEREGAVAAVVRQLLIPRDPTDDKDVILEVRAGTGGEEAALFASEIVRMYERYADRVGWKVDVVDIATTGIGGVKEAILNIRGERVYGRLRWESGVHRVQRVPATEASGRIHTSAVTVAVLPEAEEIEVRIDEEKELRIDRFCSSGPGGQSVNTTYSAIRITHLPTGLVVSCQDEKSQIKNRAKALKVLRARLFEIQQNELQESRAAERRSQIKTGDRSEKIRTYNFRENRVSDHRIGLTIHTLPEILNGDLDTILDTLETHFRSEELH